MALKVGTIIKKPVLNTNPPKTKFFIILGSDKHKSAYAYIFINTDINFNIINSAELQALQHLIPRETNPFLDYDSYADCSDVKQYIDCAKLDSEVSANPEYNKGQLNDNDLQIILRMIREADTTLPAFIKAYKFI